MRTAEESAAHGGRDRERERGGEARRGEADHLTLGGGRGESRSCRGLGPTRKRQAPPDRDKTLASERARSICRLQLVPRRDEGETFDRIGVCCGGGARAFNGLSARPAPPRMRDAAGGPHTPCSILEFDVFPLQVRGEILLLIFFSVSVFFLVRRNVLQTVYIRKVTTGVLSQIIQYSCLISIRIWEG